jgi:hypothetical protein
MTVGAVKSRRLKVDWTCKSDDGSEKYIQNVGAETSWKPVALKTGNRPSIKKGHRQTGSEDGR